MLNLLLYMRIRTQSVNVEWHALRLFIYLRPSRVPHSLHLEEGVWSLAGDLQIPPPKEKKKERDRANRYLPFS